jgi:DHA3 family macrolide efflux protein-like MFS transporter
MARKTLYISAIALFVLSEGVYDLAFANLAFSVNGQASSVATTYAVGYLAEITITLLGAGFLDHFDKRKIFVGSILATLIAFICAILWFAQIGVSEIAVWSFAFVVDLIHHCTRLAAFALVPFLFSDKDEIVAVNAASAVLNGLVRVGSPVFGALAIGLVGTNLSLLISALALFACLIVSAALVAKVGALAVTSNSTSTEALSVRVLQALGGVSRSAVQIMRDPEWRMFLLMYSGTVLFIGVANLLWIPLLRTVTDLSEAQTGYLIAFGAMGLLIGGIFLRRFSRWKSRPTSAMGLASVILTIGVGLAAFSKSIPIAAVAIFVFNLGLTFYFRTATVFFQTAIPKEIIGSWYGAVDAAGRIFGLVGILVAGRIFDSVGGTAMYVSICGVLALSSIYWLRTSLSLGSGRTAQQAE